MYVCINGAALSFVRAVCSCSVPTRCPGTKQLAMPPEICFVVEMFHGATTRAFGGVVSLLPPPTLFSALVNAARVLCLVRAEPVKIDLNKPEPEQVQKCANEVVFHLYKVRF